jgi:hypothetical protein
VDGPASLSDLFQGLPGRFADVLGDRGIHPERLEVGPKAFEETMAFILAFVGPAYRTGCEGSDFRGTWSCARRRWE